MVFDITNNCNSSGCPPMFQFNTQSGPGCRAGTLVVAVCFPLSSYYFSILIQIFS